MITLYDIPCSENKPWSPNTWKARYALNIKKVQYDTKWLEYPDIESTCKKIGADPTSKKPDGRPHYTLPVIIDGESVIPDSIKIAAYLDSKYPTPDKHQLIPKESFALYAAFEVAFTSAIDQPNSLFPLVMQPTADKLNQGSQEYFQRTKPCTLLPEGEEARTALWTKLENGFGTVAGWFDKNPAGQTFISGDQPTFADIVIAARLMWIRQIWGEESKEWKIILGWHDGRWAKLMNALKSFE